MSISQENKVLFKFGTLSNYTALSEKDEGTLYFIDNGQLYLGDQLIGSTYEYDDYTDGWPETPVKGRLYIDTASGMIQDYNGEEWIPIVSPVQNFIEITYSDLVTLRNTSKLIPGVQYKITDYTCTTVTENTRSAGHVFDIIVTALDESTLSNEAKATHHDGDTYFANCNLGAWELKYCLDNDTNRFAWADENSGKGVIYYMKDEFQNECPYDFKNIQFMRWEDEHGNYSGTAGDEEDGVYVYTFNSFPSPDDESEDYSMSDENSVHHNVVNFYNQDSDLQILSNNVFFSYDNYNNTLGVNCNENTILGSYNTLSYWCSRNIISYENIIGSHCDNNYIQGGINILGKYCTCNNLDASENILDDFCNYIVLEYEADNNIFGKSCNDITLSEQSSANVFGDNCSNLNIGGQQQGRLLICKYIRVGDNVHYCNIEGATPTENFKMNLEVLSGTSGTSSSPLSISIPANQNFLTYVGLDSNGTLRTWVPADAHDLLQYIEQELTEEQKAQARQNIDSAKKLTYVNFDFTNPNLEDFNDILSAYREGIVAVNAAALVTGVLSQGPFTTIYLLGVSDTGCTVFSIQNVLGNITYTTTDVTLLGNPNTDNKQYCVKNGEWVEVEAGISELVVETTYSALKSLRDAGNLVPGTQYRITDYTTTTIASNTQSAGHVFDIIVTADDANTLREDARAIQHEGDTYFANSNLDAWELKYCLDNDTNRFDWADTANGKGVIYYMKDEFNNECSYDFKNIQFMVGAKSNAGTKANVYYYTFSVATGTNDATVADHSLNSGYCYSNSFKEYIRSKKQSLNFIVCRNTSITSNCYGNSTGSNCYNIVCGNGCLGWTCGNNCYGWTCGDNCTEWTCGDKCTEWTCGDNCYHWSCGNGCCSWSCGNGCCSWSCGNDCYHWSCGDICSYWSCGNNCCYWKFGSSTAVKNFYRRIMIDDGCQYFYLDTNQTTTGSNYIQNIHICQGITGTYNAYKTITVGIGNNNCTIRVENDLNDNIYIYNLPAELNKKGDVSASSSLTSNQVVIGNTAKTIKTLPAGTDGTVLSMQNGTPAWVDVDSSIDNKIATAIGALDSSVTASANSLLIGITQTDGKLTDKTEAELSLVQSTNPSITSYQEWQLKLGTSQIGSNIVIPLNSTITTAQIGHALDTLNSDGTITFVTSGTNNYDVLHIVYYNPETNTYAKVSADISSLTSGNAVTLNELATPTDGYLKTYQISQGSNVIGTIDIPKDFLIKSGSVKSVTVADTPYTGAKVDDKYIDFIINVKEGSATDQHIYIPVNDLVDVYTAEQNATQIQLAISATNEISATIVAGSVGTTELANGAVTTAKIADANVTEAKLETNLQNKIDGAIQTVKVNGTALSEDSNNAVNITVASGTQNGTIAVNSTDVAVTGLQSAAFTEVEDNVNGIQFNTSSGKLTTSKQVADFVEASLLRWGIIPGPRQLTFTANEDNSGVGFCCWSEDVIEVVDMGKNIQYSTDGGVNWYDYEIGLDEDNVVMIDLNEGDSVMFKGINENLAYYWEDYGDYLYTKCIIEGSVAASGDVTSLLNGVGGDVALAVRCFYCMFLDCAGLTTAPSLPSMTLAEHCYGYMFQSCTGLTTAPVLPATTLADHCYTNMFYGCTELTSIEVHHTSWLPDRATNRWLKDVSTNGTFRCPSALPQTRGMSNIPNNWAIETF